MSAFEVSLVSPAGIVFLGEAHQVDLPGIEGDLGVLAGHAPTWRSSTAVSARFA